MGVVFGVEDAAHRVGLLNLLALGAKQKRQSPSFTNIDEVIAGRLAVAVSLMVDHEILQQALGGKAGGQLLDMGLGVPHFASVLRRLLKPVERNEQGDFGF